MSNKYGIFKKGIFLDIPVAIPLSHKTDFLEKISKEEWFVYAKDHGYFSEGVVNIGIEIKEKDKGRAFSFIESYVSKL